MSSESLTKKAFRKRDDLQEARSASFPDTPHLERTHPLFTYIFDLQARCEKTGTMNYHTYADMMWRELLGADPDHAPDLYKQFEADLIAGLQDIDMSTLVYEHVIESLNKLIETYLPRVKKIFLWSTGDVSSTGYQVIKINRSHIVEKFYRSLLGKAKKDGVIPRILLDEKAEYLVADNKFTSLGDVVRDMNLNSSEGQTIVIIDDSVNNFQKASDILYTQLPTQPFTVIPIWAVYSREGLTAKKNLQPNEFAQKKEKLNGIESFAELLDEDRFGTIFNNAIVLVDFDGVIGDNIKMRDEQAYAIYRALLQAEHSLKGSEIETLGAEITTRAKKILETK